MVKNEKVLQAIRDAFALGMRVAEAKLRKNGTLFSMAEIAEESQILEGISAKILLESTEWSPKNNVIFLDSEDRII